MLVSPAHASILLDIARDAIRRALDDGRPPASWADLEPGLLRPAGCFVSLHRVNDRALRGCVGCLEAQAALAQTVRDAAAGVIHDPRFRNDPVSLEELPELELEITVVSPLTPADGPHDFDLQNEGIYLTLADRAGCFLPQVARETGWTREQLLNRLCTEKLGLPSIAWRHPRAKLLKFSACILGPDSFAKIR